jgi:hypothetical protein
MIALVNRGFDIPLECLNYLLRVYCEHVILTVIEARIEGNEI